MSDTYGSGLSFGAPESAGGPAFAPDAAPAPGAPLDITPGTPDAAPQPAAPPREAQSEGFGSSLRKMLPGMHYDAPDPQSSALDQASSVLEQRVKRAGSIATNPLAQIFAPEQAQAARDFMPKAAEQLQKIEQQKSAIQAGRVQAQTLGLAPGEVSDQATQEDRLTIASAKALKGDMKVFQGIQAVDPARAAAIAPQVHEVVAGHLTKAQLAFDSLASMQNEGQYQAKLAQLRQDGTLTDLESLGMKVPPSFDAFGATKAMEGRALREARIGINSIGQQLEARNTYVPMEKKEQETYAGSLKTLYGDEMNLGPWSRNAASGTRGQTANGIATVDDYGKTGAAASPEQRKEIREDFAAAVPKEALEKVRSLDRIGTLATKDTDGKFIPPEGVVNKKGERIYLNTNPNIQQGLAEGFAAALRGGGGGATGGLLNIETGKRGAVQALLDKIKAGYNGGLNVISGDQVRGYLTTLTQKQQREVLDGLREYNTNAMGDRALTTARRAGALGLDVSALGLGKDEAGGIIGSAIEEGRQAQIERMRQNFQPIGSGNGVLQLGAQRPGAGEAPLPQGAQPANQIPGAQPLQTPVQQQQGGAPAPQPGPGAPPAPQQPPEAPGGNPAAPTPPAPQAPQPAGPGAAGGSPVAPQPAAPRGPQPVDGAQPAPPLNQGPAGGAGQPSPAPAPGGTPAPVTVAGQQVSVALPAGATSAYVNKMQRIESGQSKDPWTAEVRAKKADGKTPITSASGAFQMLDSTWNDNKPAGAPARAKDATPAQQVQALETYTQKQAATLTRNGVPVTDTSLYVAHNLGAAGGSKLMNADPGADAREVVGEVAARNNPKFFKGRPTVATVLQRYAAEMDKGEPTGTQVASAATGVQNDGSELPPPTGAFNARQRAAREAIRTGASGPDLSSERRPGQWGEAGNAAIEHAPAIGSTIGGVGGFMSPVPGGAAIGGGIGGAAGQSLKDYLKGNPQNPKEIAKQGALGAVLGIFPEGRPIAGAVARTVGAGGIQAADKATEPGSDNADVVDAGVKGLAYGLGGEALGRFVSSAGANAYKALSRYTVSAQHELSSQAGKLSAAREVMTSEPPKVPGAGGTEVPNPKYEAAKKQSDEATQAIKDHGQVPDDMVHAYEQAKAGVSAGEAAVLRKGASEKAATSEGYNQLRQDVQQTGVGAPKANQPVPDGPLAQLRTANNMTGKVPEQFRPEAEHAEMLIKAPAKDWGEKWQQLQNAGTELIEKRRASLAAGDKPSAKAMDNLFDGVRAQQKAAAEYVFGKVKGQQAIKKLEDLDRSYARIMNATEGMSYGKMQTVLASGNTPERRELEKNFKEFAKDDPSALRAFNAMKAGARGAWKTEAALMGPVIAGEVAANMHGVPTVGVISALVGGHRLYKLMQGYMNARTLNAAVTFKDFLTSEIKSGSLQIPGNAVQRAAVSVGAAQQQ